ncbi:hypothetical protein ACYOEI_01130 [Singulisphaera rosea]
MATEESLNQLATEVFGLNSPKIDESRRLSICELLKATINGDTIKAHLAINANVKPDVMGALVYVLTDRRIIKFDIGPSEIKSVTFPLDTITGILRSLEGNRAGITLSFQNGSFGMKYTIPNQKISDFFQKVDLARVSKINGSPS